MARKSTKEDRQETPGILPVPEPVIRHHGPTLFAPMREWASIRRVPPVLLITGTAGSGKRHLSYWLAQWILCERSGFAAPQGSGDSEGEIDMFSGSLFGGGGETPEPEAPVPATPAPAEGVEPGPCGECASCQRALKGNWVDFTEVLPEDSDGDGSSSGTLKVDQFRKIKATLGFGAHEGAFRIVLIPNADRMTVQAANSVLKLLEEPPPGWLFFLTASDPTLVLPTILSRCQTLRLKPFPASTIAELLALAGVPRDRAAICAHLAQGSWSKALAISSDEIWEHRQTIFDFLKEPGASLSALVDWASSSNAHFELLVDQLEQISSELIRWSVSPEIGHPENYPWVNSDGQRSLVAHAKEVTQRQGSPAGARDFWIARAERLARVRQEALAPLNRKILVQDLLIPWLGG